jgi:dipeptidyl aminopeptidase/acylaminoacyl peptidase
MYTKGDVRKQWTRKAYLEDVIGHDSAQLRAYFPVNHVDKIKASVMLIHGK